MLQRIIEVNHDLCTGCRYCEQICSFRLYKAINPNLARIKIVKTEAGLNVPVVCEHCEEAFCRDICPVMAIKRDSKTGAIVIDGELCVGCRACAVACPFGMIVIDPSTGRATKCDLCDGEPRCVKHCTTEALRYVKTSRAFEAKRIAKAREIAHF